MFEAITQANEEIVQQQKVIAECERVTQSVKHFEKFYWPS